MNKKAKTFAYSPYITWALSHWNQTAPPVHPHRPQRRINAAFGLRPDHAVYLQWTWIIGSHSHGWQQR